MRPEASARAGQAAIEPAGANAAIEAAPAADARIVDAALLRAWPLPDSAGDKEARGAVLIVAGCKAMPGAATLAAEAAMRAGAGKLEVAVPEGGAPLVAAALPEAKVLGFAETRAGGPRKSCLAQLREAFAAADALLLGPGMTDPAAVARLAAAAVALEQPTVLDAAALTLLHDPELRFAQPVLVTPHAGEMAQILGVARAAVEAEPVDMALRLARRANVVVVMKGETTHVVSPEGRVWTYEDGHVGLGMSGSGDVLAGLITGLLARRASLAQAAVWGVALHGRAAHAVAARVGRLGYLARELAAEVPRIMEALR